MRRSLARSSFFCGALLVVRSAAKPVFENCTAGGITPGWVNDAHLRVHTLTPGDPLDVLADEPISGPARRLIEYMAVVRGLRGPRASGICITMYAGPVSELGVEI